MCCYLPPAPAGLSGRRFIASREVDARSDDLNVASVGMSRHCRFVQWSRRYGSGPAPGGDTLGGYEVRGQSASGELGEVVDFRVVD